MSSYPILRIRSVLTASGRSNGVKALVCSLFACFEPPNSNLTLTLATSTAGPQQINYSTKKSPWERIEKSTVEYYCQGWKQYY